MHQRWGINPSDLCESDQFVTMRHLGHLNSVLHAFVWYLIACTVITQCNAQQPGTTCKRLLWFAAIGPEHGTMDWDYYLAALASAHSNAPSLTPVLIWLGPTRNHGLWLTWLREQGVLIIDHRLSIQEQAEEAQAKGWVHPTWLLSRNTYAVIDVPSIAQNLRPALDPEIYDTNHVLWTELPVYFTNDVNSCSFGMPALLGMGPEAFQNNQPSNSAVMHLNVDAMALQAPHIVDTAVRKKWDTVGGVQGLFLEHFAGKMDVLRETLNYKTYWGYRPDAQIVTFHAMMPATACWRCFVKQRSMAVINGTSGCCPAHYDGLLDMSLKADSGKFFATMDEAWNSEVNHARQHYHVWSEVYMAAQSHINYLRVAGLRRDRWHSRAVQVKGR